MANQPKRRPGRPPIREDDRRSRNFTFRSRGSLHDKLLAASRSGERSISEEIERRLENSFDRAEDTKGLLAEALQLTHGPKLAGILRALGQYMEAAGHYADQVSKGRNQYGPFREQWLQNPYAFDEAVKAANFLLERFRPEGAIVSPAPLTDAEKAILNAGPKEADSYQHMLLHVTFRHLLQQKPPHLLLNEALDGKAVTPELKAWADSIIKQTGGAA